MIKPKVVFVLEREFHILSLIDRSGPCNSFDIHQQLPDEELLNVMRTIHQLADRGLLDRVQAGNSKLYKTGNNFRFVKVFKRTIVPANQ